MLVTFANHHQEKHGAANSVAKAPAEIAPSPSNTIGTLEKPKSFSLNLLLGELPTLHQIKTVQYWFRSGNGLNHEADSAKKPQVAVKLAMSNNNSCRNTPAHESTRQTQCYKHCRQFLFDWFGWSRGICGENPPLVPTIGVPWCNVWCIMMKILSTASRNRLPKPQTTLKTPYERYKTTPATPHAWRQDNGCQVKDSVNTTKKYIDENSGKMQKDIGTFELQCP